MTPYEQAARSWTEHLRSGGATPWSTWVARPAATDVAVPPGWTMPGAAQLELVRRLADRLARSDDTDAFRGLADLVIGRSGPGRGRAQQPLSWTGTGDGPRRFGAPPVDPADVPADELVRVGVGALTELLLRAPDAPAAHPARRRLFTRTPAFTLAGAPVTTSVVRQRLEAAGHVEGGDPPRVLLVVEPFDVTLAQVWSARVQRGAPVRWPGFVERWSGRRELPPSADYPALARLWAERVGPAEVHVLVAPVDPVTATRDVARLLDVDPTPRRALREPRWRDLSPPAADVVRRVNAVLNVRSSASRHDAVARTLVATLGTAGRRHPLTVPEPFRDWATARSRAVAEELSAGGYSVHGDPEQVVPRFEDVPTRPRLVDVLDVLLDACLDRAVPGATRKADQR
ncbi:hypothetical protein KRR39_19635 [Nocardioides panacis]|uniref:Uncharacterized protein n=1 Tax=Nocardioides panacis TaxID=2849501 RepID=A0A975XZT5_9ACTN|nr:hypothetical protein [Nocardioides panacis]QWZ07609.1 hypothetical protein KRR39_19635 [Nocardioides panacis]